MDTIDTMKLPWFRIERTDDQGKVCELPMCYPAAPATHKVTFNDNGSEILICDKHALGIVALAEYVNQPPIELKKL